MSAQIVGFVTRAEAGLLKPTSVSKNITPEKGGVAIHYGGGPQAAANPHRDHHICVETWRKWQWYHMTERNFVDTAYTGGFCNHGFAFAGRGLGVRTGANGTNPGNQNYYAIVWLGGLGQVPSREALNAADWWIDKLRKAGAADGVKPHQFFKPTGCPGDPLVGFSTSRDGKPVYPPGAPAPTPTPAQPNSLVTLIQEHVEVEADGKWGPTTDSRVMFMRHVAWAYRGWPSNRPIELNDDQVKMAQRVIDTPDDGVWGRNSLAAHERWIKKMQTIIGVTVDGWWGTQSDTRLLTLRRRHLNNY